MILVRHETIPSSLARLHFWGHGDTYAGAYGIEPRGDRRPPHSPKLSMIVNQRFGITVKFLISPTLPEEAEEIIESPARKMASSIHEGDVSAMKALRILKRKMSNDAVRLSPVMPVGDARPGQDCSAGRVCGRATRAVFVSVGDADVKDGLSRACRNDSGPCGISEPIHRSNKQYLLRGFGVPAHIHHVWKNRWLIRRWSGRIVAGSSSICSRHWKFPEGASRSALLRVQRTAANGDRSVVGSPHGVL